MPSKIVFLDRDTTDAGDIDLQALESLGTFESYGITSPDEVAERVGDAEILLSNKVVIGPAEMDAAARLRLIQVAATGVNNIDIEAAKDRSIVVCNVSGYSTPAVAQHVFATLLNLVSNVHRFAQEPLAWSESPIFTRLDYPVGELQGKILGIVGLGSIGSAVAKIGEAFGMKIITLAREGATQTGAYARLEKSDFFQQADVVTLHCPLTEKNHGFINAELLQTMKPSAFLINTGRGDLVHESDLAQALKEGQIAGAALDVLSQEPPPADHPLLQAAAELPQLLITPHTAWSSREARQRLVDEIVKNLRAFLDGEEVPNRVI